MKIIFFTDNMGSGGAQRQLSMLAVLLKKRGHDVTVITYNHGDFFEYFLEKNKINRIRIESKFKWRRPIEFAKILHKLKPHGVIAFQRAPSFYAQESPPTTTIQQSFAAVASPLRFVYWAMPLKL